MGGGSIWHQDVERERKRKKSRRFVQCSANSASIIHIYTLHLYTHRKATFYMIAMNINDRFNCYCHLFWSLFFLSNAITINGLVNNENRNSTLVFFRLSGGYGRNFQVIRCATDQSSEDLSDHLVDLYPEMKGLYQKKNWREYIYRYHFVFESTLFASCRLYWGLNTLRRVRVSSLFLPKNWVFKLM